MGQQLLIYNIVAPAQGFKYSKLARLRNWKSIMSCLCCSNDDMQWPSDIAQFMGNNASDSKARSTHDVLTSLAYHVTWTHDHQRWLSVAELALPEEKGDPIYAVAWAPNIGRPYEVITTGTHKQIPIWHLGLNPNLDGKLSTEKVWKMEWNISGMTLATTGGDGVESTTVDEFKGITENFRTKALIGVAIKSYSNNQSNQKNLAQVALITLH
ncbi:hypothetical protein RHMOL_Rhmol01G0086800 [Rhododendron molle]|uniref:Uncharacterized protein n=1 Tax=Rhododendron molle TaxID=49168 RepID=A0ACC0Q242_RHOML|nr:hypothetical protein RHMOL_Rhmol01G0086800 [Rhododendron molle]